MNYYVFNQKIGARNFNEPKDAIDYWNEISNQNEEYTSIGITKDYRAIDILFKDGPDKVDFLSRDFLSSDLLNTDGKEFIEKTKALLENLNSQDLYKLFIQRYLGDEVIDKMDRYDFNEIIFNEKHAVFEVGNLILPYNHPFTQDEVKRLETFYNSDHRVTSIEKDFNELKNQYINEVLNYWQNLDRNGAFLDDLESRLHDIESFLDDVDIMEGVAESWLKDGYLNPSEYHKVMKPLTEIGMKLNILRNEVSYEIQYESEDEDDLEL